MSWVETVCVRKPCSLMVHSWPFVESMDVKDENHSNLQMGYVVIAICFPFLGGEKQQDHKCTKS